MNHTTEAQIDTYCILCGRAMESFGYADTCDTCAGGKTVVIPCDDRCMFAKGDDCDCECGGKNHKQGHKLTASQRTIVRTKAGRRVKHLTPGTFDFRLAESLYAMRQEGMTKKDIAHEANVSAPTVRRLITRYELTMAALGVELAVAA